MRIIKKLADNTTSQTQVAARMQPPCSPQLIYRSLRTTNTKKVSIDMLRRIAKAADKAIAANNKLRSKNARSLQSLIES